jgi:hypothetical protein
MTNNKPLTFEEMKMVEPLLAYLESDARDVKDSYTTPAFCANYIWFHYFKPKLLKLTGWECSNDLLSSCDCYDIAYQHLYNLLPNCRGGCWCG